MKAQMRDDAQILMSFWMKKKLKRIRKKRKQQAKLNKAQANTFEKPAKKPAVYKQNIQNTDSAKAASDATNKAKAPAKTGRLGH